LKHFKCQLVNLQRRIKNKTSALGGTYNSPKFMLQWLLSSQLQKW